MRRTDVAIPTDVRDAVVRAYYPRALAVPDGARSRAQAAYGIAAAIAAALVTAGVFGDLDKRPGLVQAIGILALVAWLVAAGLYLAAVSLPFVPATATQRSTQAFVTAAVDAAQTERDRVDHWQKKAGVASGVAALLTVVAFVAALVDTPTDSKAATVTLGDKAKAAVAAACGNVPDLVTGSVSADGLEKEFVQIKVDKGVCGDKDVVVAVPRGQVQAVAFNH
jgi:hypothetical protein